MTLARTTRHVALLAAALVGAACNVPTPMSPAAPIGEVPAWGEGFATPTQAAGDSAMRTGTAGGEGEASASSPGNTGEWTGGDAVLGKGVYTALCMRCHGETGEGGMVPGVGMATALSDAAYQGSHSDKDMAKVVALGKGAMPSFMRELDKPKLSGVIAYIRTLKK